jgi:hypothetical protein
LILILDYRYACAGLAEQPLFSSKWIRNDFYLSVVLHFWLVVSAYSVPPNFALALFVELSISSPPPQSASSRFVLSAPAAAATLFLTPFHYQCLLPMVASAAVKFGGKLAYAIFMRSFCFKVP